MKASMLQRLSMFCGFEPKKRVQDPGPATLSVSGRKASFVSGEGKVVAAKVVRRQNGDVLLRRGNGPTFWRRLTTQ